MLIDSVCVCVCVCQGGGQVISVGDMHIIKELKLANENLKWRLEQRSKSLVASKAIVDVLKDKLRRAEAQVAELKQSTGGTTGAGVGDEVDVVVMEENDK